MRSVCPLPRLRFSVSPSVAGRPQGSKWTSHPSVVHGRPSTGAQTPLDDAGSRTGPAADVDGRPIPTATSVTVRAKDAHRALTGLVIREDGCAHPVCKGRWGLRGLLHTARDVRASRNPGTSRADRLRPIRRGQSKRNVADEIVRTRSSTPEVDALRGSIDRPWSRGPRSAFVLLRIGFDVAPPSGTV